MNLSAPFIARPVATILLTLGIACAGAAAFTLLPVAPIPRIDLPAIFVNAALPGASPEVMASSIATPLERHLGAIADVNDMTSTSTVGSTNIQLVFGADRDINGAARDVQAAIEAARADLPTSLTRNPSYRRINTSQFPILAIALTSDVLTQGQIYDAADAVISQRLSQIDGVGAVNVNGSALPAVRVELNPLALAKYGIGLQDVRAAISNANANAPKGAIETAGLHYQIYTNDNARDAAAYRNLIIANRNGATVRLSDVATVMDMQDGATENIRTFGTYNGKAAVTVEVLQQAGANILKVVDAVKAALPQLRAEIAPIEMKVTFDRSAGIRGSIRQVEKTLLIAVAMVVLVVYIFLHSYRSALVPAVVVPVSLIGTCGAMYLLDFTLDTFSLMALTIATGFVVDDAVVVMENTIRHIEAGKPRMRAALDASREVGFTVLAMSLSLCAVFVPFELVGGIVGRIFREFAITLSVAILISLAISLTTTPMMCSRLLGAGRARSRRAAGGAWRAVRDRWSAFEQAFDRGFAALRATYERSLAVSLDHPRLTILLLATVIFLNFYLYVVVPKGFFPQQDTGQLRGGFRADSSASFQLVKGKLVEITNIIRADPAVESVTGTVGGGGFGPFGGGLSGNVNIILKPRRERSVSADDVIARLRPKLARVQGVVTFLQVMQDIGGGGGGRAANAEYQYTLLGDDLEELRTWSNRLRVALQSVPEVTDVDTDVQPGGLEADLIVDRNTAYRLGLTEAQIDSALGDAFAQSQVSTIYNPFSPQQYHVVMEVAPEFWQSPEVLRELYVSTAGGAVSGTQATQPLSGTTELKGSASRTGAGASAAATAAADIARNLASNSLANAGRGNTSTGSAVSISRETMVPFSAFSHFATGSTPVSVNHTGASASTSIAFNLPEGVSLDQALAAIERTMERIHVPVTIQGSAYGTALLFQQSSGNQPLLLLAAFLAIYVVLGVLYESYGHPLIILSTLPSGGLGALIALLVTGTELGIVSFLGILLLIGIVMKNAIMMVDFGLDAERRLGLDPRAAIAHACSLRFRPILMTTCAAIAGALPLALFRGEGTEMTRPLGIAIVGGLIASQLLTLYTTPVVYLYVHRLSRHRARSQRPAPPLGGGHSPAEAGA